MNNAGRCWRVINRDFQDKSKYDSGIMLRVTAVGDDGRTDDIISYELTIKEDYVDGNGWDETKTKVYTGTGLVKSIDNGRVNFEIYVDLNDGNSPITIQSYYHPGSTTADSDDKMVIQLPATMVPFNLVGPCSNSLGEAGTL